MSLISCDFLYDRRYGSLNALVVGTILGYVLPLGLTMFVVLFLVGFLTALGVWLFAFIKGRRIHDNILLVTDVIKNFGLKTTGPAMALKVDLRKAYDSVSWEFIHKTLQVYGFSAQWIKWIMQCVTSSKFSILCNGVPTGYFSAGRGIRRGCPLSPLLFTLITDHFSTLMHEKIVGGQIKLCNVVQKTGLLVSHVFYADDLFIIVKADLSTAKTVDEVLKWFHGISGLEVNKDKSSVIFSKAVRGKRRILQLLQMKNEVFPLKYLGITLVNRALKSVDCKGQFDKVNARLDHWNTINLSLAGRLELIRSVLYSFLYHWVFGFKIPWGCIIALEKKFKHFLWSGKLDSRKMSQLQWSQVTLPYAEGGFNLCRISDIDFAAKDSSIWKQILETRDFIQENVVFRIGNGGSFNMLFDPWCAEITAEFVANVPLKAGNDEISWTHGEFSLKNAWAACRTRGQVVKWKSLCWKYCRPRVAVTFVIIMHNKNLSFVNLQRRGFHGPSICHNCFQAEDTNNHLFCTCEYAVEVWQQVVIWLNTTDIRFQELSVFVEWMLQLTQVKGFKSKLLKGLFVVFVWKIWMERNAALHSGSKVSSAAAANDIIWEVLNFFSLGLADMLAIFDVG
ncbi:uncharacterized protein LOC132314136 [Cornus florida]|uniref:uncharacterized protein LOC132314136 n=1 Tax=Cornus florida TaxID=4283 RepID=UPI0028988CE5|nr:uncharacterized protein LOC132314136 [Cornus florida]